MIKRNRLRNKRGLNKVITTIILVVVAFAVAGMFSMWLSGGVRNAMQGNNLMGESIVVVDPIGQNKPRKI